MNISARSTARSAQLLAVILVSLVAAPAVAHGQAPTPQIHVDDPWVPEKNAGTSAMTFHVTLAEAATAPVTVRVATANGTAFEPSDYARVRSTTLTFAPGETDKPVPVTIVGDTQREGNETLKLTLSKPSAGAVVADPSGQGTIWDAEAPRHLSVGDVYVAEPGSGEAYYGFTVKLDQVPAAGDAAEVQYTLTPATAGFGSDWDAPSLTGHVYLDDESGGSVQVVFRVLADDTVEPAERFKITLSDPQGAVLSDSSAIAEIVSSDPTTSPQISVSDPWVAVGGGTGGVARFKLTLDHPIGFAVSVKVATGGGTATPGEDYTALPSQTVTFAPNQTSRNVDVTVFDDTRHELQETFQLRLSQPAGALIADATGIATLVDDEGPIVAYLMDAQVTEADPPQPARLEWHLRLSADPGVPTPAAVSWTTQDGTATAPSDYATWTDRQSFNLAPGFRWGQGTIVPDDVAEPTEQFSFVLSKPEGFVLGDAKATGTIIDND